MLFLICLVVPIVIGFAFGIRKRNWGDGLGVGLMVSFFAWIFFMIVCLIAIVGNDVGLTYSKEFQVYKQKKIYSLKNRHSVAGSFSMFIGSGGGSIGEQEKYLFFIEDGRGYRRNGVNVDNTIIIEDENSSPYLLEWRKSYVEENPWWFVPWKSREEGWSGRNENIRIELHVPENTIIERNKYEVK